jgi:polar amino acid transport system substrate-binding protein
MSETSVSRLASEYAFSKRDRRTFVRTLVLATSAAALVRVRPAAAADSSWEKIATSGTLKVGVIPSRPPYFWLQDGKWTGFSAEMGREVTGSLAKAMNRPLETRFVETTWPTVILDLQSGRLDSFFGLSYSKQRAEALNLFGPLYALPEVAVNRTGFAPGAQWADYDKPNVRVSVVMGTTDADAAKKLLPHADITAFKGMAEAVLAVQSAHTETLVTTALVALGAMKENTSLGQMVVLEPTYTQPSYGGTRHDSDGRLAKFLQNWATQYRQSGQCKQVILAAMRQYGLDIAKLPAGVDF